jgi:hypothetical protein
VDEDAVADVVPGDWGNVGWTGKQSATGTDLPTTRLLQYSSTVLL